MDDAEQIRSPAEIRRVFELLDNVNTVRHKGDNFKYGMQVGKLLALGWVLREVPSSDLSLHYEFDDWERDIKSQEDSLKRQLKELNELTKEDDNDDS